MKILTLIAAAVLPVIAMAYSNDRTPEDAIRAVVDKYPGEIGVAVITVARRAPLHACSTRERFSRI